ncbi:MAG: hypothetical protein B6U72_05360 [Candidatus Altiarchaeales archaeon ex4484_2]|nr:MAG: hypothetical protein B6U72_05360 [Candidatus Altiarchaeales archaeon ex4484_2]
MEFNIQIEGRHAYMILFVLVLGFASVLVFSQSSPIQGHSAEEITSGVFAGGGDYIFPTDSKVGIGINNPDKRLEVNGYVKGSSGLCIGDDCLNSWYINSGFYGAAVVRWSDKDETSISFCRAPRNEGTIGPIHCPDTHSLPECDSGFRRVLTGKSDGQGGGLYESYYSCMRDDRY